MRLVFLLPPAALCAALVGCSPQPAPPAKPDGPAEKADKPTPADVPGYAHGRPEVARSPVTLKDLEGMKKALLFTDDDVKYLRMSKDVLADQTDAVLDVWYGFVAATPELLASFTDTGTGKPDPAYLAAAGVCVGDVWAAGGALFQVSQPRQPCWKLARRWRVKDLALRVQQTGRTGWYFRVLREGLIAPGEPLALAERPEPDWTIERANRVMHHSKADVRQAAELAAVGPLSASWRSTLARRVSQGVQPDVEMRLNGLPEAGA